MTTSSKGINNDLTPAERERYSRHLMLPEVGTDGQKRLRAASVLCVGCGGLGSPLLLYLAAAGVGRIGIVDGDVVELSNLQRQVIHGEGWLGRSKAQSAASRIADLNPGCQVDVHEQMLSIENALDLIAPYDLVCDGTDNFPTRFLVNDACVLLGKPLIYGSVQRFVGQVSVFNRTADSPNYRDLLTEPPPPGEVPSCAEAGVMGVMPGLIGLLQASEAIKLITDIGKHIPLAGGIEAGLYRCNGRFFAKLAALAASQPYFTVVQAMQLFAADSELGAMMTKGRRWLALETIEQLDDTLRTTVDTDGKTHFPWQERMARADSFSRFRHPRRSDVERARSVEGLSSLPLGVMEAGGRARSSQRLVLPLSQTDHHHLVPSCHIIL